MIDINDEIEIINIAYEPKKDIAKLHIKNLTKKKEITWVLSGNDLDTFINQFIKESFSFSSSQRQRLAPLLIGKKFVNEVEIDLTKVNPNDLKDEDKMDKFHEVFDEYPFKEIVDEVIEENRENK